MRYAAFGCECVGTPVPFQQCMTFINTRANKVFHLTAGKFFVVECDHDESMYTRDNVSGFKTMSHLRYVLP